MSRQTIHPWEALLLAVLAFAGWHLTGLTDIDEGFYGAIASEMRWRGDWIVPYLNGIPWFEKPILVYWGAAASMALFGMDWGARLFSVLCSVGTIWVSYSFLKRHFSPNAATYGAWILCTSLLFLLVGRLLLADPPFVFFMTLGFSLWVRAITSEPKSAWLAGLSLGCALLAKGPIGLVVPVVVALWTAKADADLRPGVLRSLAPMIVGAIGACSVWYVPALIREPRLFWSDFIIKQNIARLAGGDLAHSSIQPTLYLPYYFMVLTVAFAPWWWWAQKGWPKSTTVPDQRERILRILGRWALVILIIFTASGSKLPHYILPAVIPLAWIASIRLGRQAPRRIVVYGTTILLSIGILVLFQLYYARSNQQSAHALARLAVRQGLPIANYQIRARKRDLSFSTSPRETALPSLNVIYGRVPMEIERLDPIFESAQATVIFTRTGRIGFTDQVNAAKRGWSLKRIQTSQEHVGFELYVLSPKSN